MNIRAAVKKVTKKYQKELVRGFRAAGVTIDQLSFIAGLEDDDLVDHRSKSYIRSRLLPVVRVAYYTAIGSRRWSYGLNGVQFFLPAVASVLAIGASSLFKDYAIETLFIVGVINALITASTMYEKMDQPGVEWANARSVCSVICREISLWYGQTNGYQDLDEKAALQLLKARTELVMNIAESELQRQIRGSIEIENDEKSGDLSS